MKFLSAQVKETTAFVVYPEVFNVCNSGLAGVGANPQESISVN